MDTLGFVLVLFLSIVYVIACTPRSDAARREAELRGDYYDDGTDI
jgi:hypothetical protein